MGKLPQNTCLSSIQGNVGNSPTAKYYRGTLSYILPDHRYHYGGTHKTQYSLEEVQTEHKASLNYEELKALQYTAGYVVKSLTEKIHCSAHPMKKKLFLHLATITEEHIGCDDEAESEQWTNSIDRGGLKHVNSMTFMLFPQMELVLRRHLNSMTGK